jgi:hypothetical protein
MYNFMCQNESKIQEYFTRKKTTRTPDPIHSRDLSQCDFWFFGYAKKQLKERLITDKSDLENKLTGIWEHVSQDVLQSDFFEWIERLKWVIGHEGDYYTNPY